MVVIHRWYEEASTATFELEEMLKTRDAILCDAKVHLIKAQELMKNNADKHRDVEFAMGTSVSEAQAL